MNTNEKLEFIKNSDIINFYHLNKSSFPPEVVAEFEKNYDIMYYLFNVATPFFADIHEPVHHLMMKQFPAFRTEKRPTLVKEMETITTAAGVDLVMVLANIVTIKSEGKSISSVYAPFNQWVKDNTFPKDKWERVKDRERIEFGASDSTDEEWEEIKKEENRFRRQEIKWMKKRRFDYMDLLQNIMLKHFKGFDLLDADDLLVYSLFLRKEYEDYNGHCELIEDFIDWGLPEEDYQLDYSTYTKKQIAMGNEKRWEIAGLRYRRVNGEEI
jgi:hypothetical protein